MRPWLLDTDRAECLDELGRRPRRPFDTGAGSRIEALDVGDAVAMTLAPQQPSERRAGRLGRPHGVRHPGALIGCLHCRSAITFRSVPAGYDRVIVRQSVHWRDVMIGWEGKMQ
jgi:hypothetical protein